MMRCYAYQEIARLDPAKIVYIYSQTMLLELDYEELPRTTTILKSIQSPDDHYS